jgi:uncharacterized protein YdeI (YjbR/CyaY-like superfamily)
VFFATPARFRAWLERNGARAPELLVGFHKVASGRPSITWPESVDEALCFGWIDGVRRRIDDASYSIRFTPRRPRSIWSAVNMKRAKELIAGGRMTAAGKAAFDARGPERTGIYAYENRKAAAFDPAQERAFKRKPTAWAWFQAQPPSYRTTVTWWVVSAKKDETRARRLETLIAECAAGRRIGLTPPPKRA